jgi:hypothetical protein
MQRICFVVRCTEGCACDLAKGGLLRWPSGGAMRSCAVERWRALHGQGHRAVRRRGDIRNRSRGACESGRMRTWGRCRWTGCGADCGERDSDGFAQFGSGGVVHMEDGTVTFKGGSISNSKAVRAPSASCAPRVRIDASAMRSRPAAPGRPVRCVVLAARALLDWAKAGFCGGRAAARCTWCAGLRRRAHHGQGHRAVRHRGDIRHRNKGSCGAGRRCESGRCAHGAGVGGRGEGPIAASVAPTAVRSSAAAWWTCPMEPSHSREATSRTPPRRCVRPARVARPASWDGTLRGAARPIDGAHGAARACCDKWCTVYGTFGRRGSCECACRIGCRRGNPIGTRSAAQRRTRGVRCTMRLRFVCCIGARCVLHRRALRVESARCVLHRCARVASARARCIGARALHRRARVCIGARCIGGRAFHRRALPRRRAALLAAPLLCGALVMRCAFAARLREKAGLLRRLSGGAMHSCAVLPRCMRWAVC